MKIRAYEGISIDQCAGCGGSWLDAGEIVPIVKQAHETFSEDQQLLALRLKGQDHRNGKLITCPKCSTPMEIFQYAVNSGVILDRCPSSHGLWFDRGELEKIQIVMEEYAVRRGEQLPKTPINTTRRLCPRDGAALRTIRYETEAVNLCPTCGGIWCDHDELTKIVASRERVFDEQELVDLSSDKSKSQVIGDHELTSSLACVVCAKTMRRLNYAYNSGVIIDRCNSGHGVWLDKDELEKLQVFAERWAAQTDRLQSSLAGLLQHARASAEAGFDEAVAAGKAKGRQASRIGRFLGRIWS